MPNLIEQQDLLKGLPDARLATLLQNPVATVPPFLVAAEAQRRQAIRQQFAGGSNESVIDTLTKQMAKVPENLGDKESPTEAPDLKGILDKAQEIKDQASTQQEQDSSGGMAGGGIVSRYADGGLASLPVRGTTYGFSPGLPTEQAIGSLARASSVIPQTMGIMPGSLGYQAKPQQSQQMRQGGMVQRYAGGELVTPFRGRQGTGGYTPGSEPPGFGVLPNVLDYFSNSPLLYRLKKYGLTPSPEQIRQIEAENLAAQTPSLPAPEIASDIAAQKRRLDTTGRAPAAQPPKASAGKAGTSPENKAKTPEDDLRKQLEALYAPQDISDWEKAQRWFAMAAQFLDPSKTTMQSIAGAGQAFAAEAGSQAQAQREADIAGKKALLEYDMAERDRIQQAQAARAQREYEAALKVQERRTVSANNLLDFYRAKIESLNRSLGDIDKDQMMDEAQKAKLKEPIYKQIDDVNRAASGLTYSSGYGPVAAPTIDELNAALQQGTAGR